MRYVPTYLHTFFRIGNRCENTRQGTINKLDPPSRYSREVIYDHLPDLRGFIVMGYHCVSHSGKLNELYRCHGDAVGKNKNI